MGEQLGSLDTERAMDEAVLVALAALLLLAADHDLAATPPCAPALSYLGAAAFPSFSLSILPLSMNMFSFTERHHSPRLARLRQRLHIHPGNGLHGLRLLNASLKVSRLHLRIEFLMWWFCLLRLKKPWPHYKVYGCGRVFGISTGADRPTDHRPGLLGNEGGGVLLPVTEHAPTSVGTNHSHRKSFQGSKRMEATVSIVPHHHRVACVPPAYPRNHDRWGQSQLYRKSLPNALKLLPSPPPSSCCLSGRRPKGCTFSSASDSAETATDQLALLLEVDGVIVDAYRVGNRKAFNKAFQKLGLDCASWTEPVYTDLARKSDGDEEMMMVLYFNRIGWPSSLPTSEKSSFIKSVLEEKKNAMDEYMMSEDLPFRPGVQKFIDDACEKGIPVVVVTSYSKCGEKVARFIIERLGEKRTSKIKVVGWKEVEQSLYGQLVLGKGMLSGLDEQLSKEVRKAVSAEKQRIAEEVASLLKLRVELDTNSPESSDKIVAALRAAAEVAEAPVRNCILIAGSLPGVRGCERVGMPCIVVRNSFMARAEIPSTSAFIMDGFGEPDLTISRLQLRKWC